ncbi:hypothetical protein BAUCODRAFT_353431 [Baudoinia panamericana UAMH 10762]|uniref:Uncharacterized protein n=1 Tax=Baudoinia panamericana (strain UAMH 10762) TaxID=717646 RepID=M2MSM0_BAUPA|nr:uncharacterized protein BAUCODRAFT_353431 [Baudoinia panamericana UAMH 10762]EMC99876.1 hypothetical protein BAUCODRAFT_353431 [Baudoinia panamericana UAMH 10762]
MVVVGCCYIEISYSRRGSGRRIASATAVIRHGCATVRTCISAKTALKRARGRRKGQRTYSPLRVRYS